jgi:hypothetical protein
LLWSVKEAVVKALGCAFHFVDPLQIHVYPSIEEDAGYAFRVNLSGKALARFSTGAGPLWVRSFPLVRMWLSIAVLNRHIDTAVGGSMLRACPRLAATRRMSHWQLLPNQADLLSSQRGDPG